MSSFFGIVMSSLQPAISATSLSAVGNATTSLLTVSAANSRGSLTYSWQITGTSCTINTSSSASTTFTGSGVAGTTVVFCNIRDSVTGVTTSSPSCTISWSVPPVTQNVTISGTTTFNGAAQSYTLTGSPASPAPSGTPSTFTNSGTYTYPTNITSPIPPQKFSIKTIA